jgi:hypothetical protein
LRHFTNIGKQRSLESKSVQDFKPHELFSLI